MNHAEMREWKERLLALRASLRGDVHQMADAVLNDSRSKTVVNTSRMPIHMADVGTDAFEREFTIRLIENEEGTLDQVEAALERIENGTYGNCAECGARIPKARLKAIPYATFCVKCASQWEMS